MSSPERKAICKFTSANGPHVTLGTSCKKSIKANALLVYMGLLQARVTCFVLVAFSMKQPLSFLQPLRQVQAPTTNRLDLGHIMMAGGIPSFILPPEGFVTPNDAHGQVWPWVLDQESEG